MKLEMVRGTTEIFEISVTNRGEPYTLTSGEELVFGIRQKYSDDEAVLVKTTTEEVDAGVYSVKLVPEDTINLKDIAYFYDVGLRSGTDFYNVIEPSPFILKKNATKWSTEE
jgi:hypothetical protein